MLSSYYYFMASLPTLSFGMPPPLSTDELLEYAEACLPTDDHALLAHVAQDAPASEHPLGAQVVGWEAALRNALVAARAARHGREATPYLRNTAPPAPADVRATVQEAVKERDPLAAETQLDKLRWSHYDELCATQPFSLAQALSYLLKLRVLERWAALDDARGSDALEQAIHGASPVEEDENRKS